MNARFDVTCRQYFWQNDRGLLRATAVTRESAHKVDSGEENSPAAPARIRTRNLSIASLALLPTSYPGSPGSAVVLQAKAPIVTRDGEIPSLAFKLHHSLPGIVKCKQLYISDPNFMSKAPGSLTFRWGTMVVVPRFPMTEL